MIKPGMRLLVWSFFALHAVMATGEGGLVPPGLQARPISD